MSSHYSKASALISGSTKRVAPATCTLTKPGISYIFCNIHPEMSAVVVALDTPYYGISDQHGQVVITGVPAGKYVLRVWHESALPDTLKAMTREVTISASSSTLGVLRLAEGDLSKGHKNLYGLEYDRPAPDNPVYNQPIESPGTRVLVLAAHRGRVARVLHSPPSAPTTRPLQCDWA